MWSPEVVEPFTNAPLHYADQPAEVTESFSKDIITVRRFLEDFEIEFPHNLTPQMERDEHFIRKLQHFLLSGLTNTTAVGIYNGYLLNAIYKFGYFHPEATRLAYMYVFCAIILIFHSPLLF